MNWQHVWIVFSTDFMNTLRDRRTWFAMIIVPLLLVPLLLIAAPTAIEGQMRRLEANPPEVAVLGSEHAPRLVAFLGRSIEIQLVESEDPWTDLSEGNVKAVIEIEPDAQAIIARGETGRVVLHFDASDQVSEIARSRIQRILSIYSQSVVADRLEARGIAPEILVPLQTELRDVAPESANAGQFLAMIMPMMLAVWAALGGMYAAIDAVAGEKERGTLEPLLATPPSRGSLVFGKYLTVVLTSVIATLIALVAMYVSYLIKPTALGEGVTGASLALPVVNLAVALVVLVLLAAFFSAVQLALSAFARTFREAQSYLSPMSIAVVLPGIMTQVADPATVADWYYAVPILNTILLLKQVLLNAIDWNQFILTALSSLVIVVVALWYTAGLFRKEEVLFRT